MTTYLTRAESRRVDRIAVETFGYSGLVLMENAGRGAVDTLQLLDVVRPDRSILILCGKGNNGGDGFVMARHLQIRGMRPTVALLCEPSELTGDAETNYRLLLREDCPLRIFPRWNSENRNEWGTLLRHADIVIDALLGTGAVGAPREPYVEAIRAVNAHCRPNGIEVVAVDIPSGLDADTGLPNDPTVVADATLTFFSQKKGFAEPAAQNVLGNVYVHDIGIPATSTLLDLVRET